MNKYIEEKLNLIEFVEKNYEKSPNHLKIALIHNVPINRQPIHVLRYFKRWFNKKV